MLISLFKFKNIYFVLLLLFFVELLVLFSSIDLIPFVYLFLGLIVSKHLKKSDEEDYRDASNFTSLFFKVSIVLLSLFVSVFGFLLITNYTGLSTCVSTLLSETKWFLFLIYGFSFPVLFSFFFTWFFTGLRPIVLGYGEFYLKITLIHLFIGFIVCMNWSSYIIIHTLLLNL